MNQVQRSLQNDEKLVHNLIIVRSLVTLKQSLEALDRLKQSVLATFFPVLDNEVLSRPSALDTRRDEGLLREA